MEFISKILFGIANSLLIPDIILLIALLIRAIILLGSFYAQFSIRRKNIKLLQEAIDKASEYSPEELLELLPKSDNSLVIPYLRELLEHYQDEDYTEYVIANFENRVVKDLAISRILSKMGPVLGLAGTLIAMSPALVGLSTGDIAGMAFNMQVVFSTTVVGLVISSVGIITLQYKQRWYDKDVNNLLYLSRVFLSK